MALIGRVSQWLAAGAIWLYCAGLALLTALWSLQANATWWIRLSDVLALYLFVPLLVLAPAALFVRRHGVQWPLLLAVTLFVVSFGGSLIPPPATEPAGMPLRVMTFNTLFYSDDPAAIVAAIRAQDADVVGLQELAPAVAAAIERELSSEYPYQLLAPAPNDKGQGTLSRYPFQSPGPTDVFHGQWIELNIGSVNVRLYNVHLRAPRLETGRLSGFERLPIIEGYDTSIRDIQAEWLLRSIDAHEGPLIVMGDFNTSDREPLYDEFAARLVDAYRTTAWGLGYTFPNPHYGLLPVAVVRIDYIWSRGGVTPAAAEVECQVSSSDHCLVVADLRIERG